MTMLSFRVDEDEERLVREAAARLGIARSELLREALRRHLDRLASLDEPSAYEEVPLTADERALAAVAEWGPAEDWSDWDDAAG